VSKQLAPARSVDLPETLTARGHGFEETAEKKVALPVAATRVEELRDKGQMFRFLLGHSQGAKHVEAGPARSVRAKLQLPREAQRAR